MTTQERIDELNATITCPQGCPGNDFDTLDGNIVCGCCGTSIEPTEAGQPNAMTTIQEVRKANRKWFTPGNKKFFGDVAYSVRHSSVTGKPVLVRSTYAWSDMFGQSRKLHWRINPLDDDLQIQPLVDEQFASLDAVTFWLRLN